MSLKVESFVISAIGSNCFVLYDDGPVRDAVIMDPGDTELTPVFDFIRTHDLKVSAVWATHAHFDHVMGADIVRDRYGVPIWIHEADMPLWDEMPETTNRWLGRQVAALARPNYFWNDGDVIHVGVYDFHVMHTPGHSPGSVSLIGQTLAFTGDTLFAGSIGRTDFPLSNPSDMKTSLNKLLTLDDALVLYPGHGPHTTMAVERRSNPYLR